MERVKRSVGLKPRLLGLIDWQRCYNCFPNGFLLDAFSIAFWEHHVFDNSKK